MRDLLVVFLALPRQEELSLAGVTLMRYRWFKGLFNPWRTVIGTFLGKCLSVMCSLCHVIVSHISSSMPWALVFMQNYDVTLLVIAIRIWVHFELKIKVVFFIWNIYWSLSSKVEHFFTPYIFTIYQINASIYLLSVYY